MDLAKMSAEELEAETIRIGNLRSEAEQKYKGQQHAIQQERSRRAALVKLEDALSGLDPDERAAVLANLTKE